MKPGAKGSEGYIDPGSYREPIDLDDKAYLDFYPSTRCTIPHVMGVASQVVLTSYEFWPFGNVKQMEELNLRDLQPNARLVLDFDSAIALYEQLGQTLGNMKIVLRDLAERAERGQSNIVAKKD